MIRTLATLSLATLAVAAAPSPATADSQRWSGDGFVVTASTRETAVAGATVDVELVVTPSGGYKVNREYPSAVEIAAPADVSVAKTRLVRADGSIDHARATFHLALTPRTAGTKQIGLKLRFALCTDSTCEPRRHEASLRLDVK